MTTTTATTPTITGQAHGEMMFAAMTRRTLPARTFTLMIESGDLDYAQVTKAHGTEQEGYVTSGYLGEDAVSRNPEPHLTGAALLYLENLGFIPTPGAPMEELEGFGWSLPVLPL